MKTKLMTVFLTAASAFAFASEPMATTNELPLEVKQSLAAAQQQQNRDWFGYMRMGLADSRAADVKRVLPGLGLGARYFMGESAFDLSASYTGDEAFADQTNTYFYTLPRLSYLYYVSPTKSQSFYGGAGLAYGGLKTKDAVTFAGVIPSVSLGYEMNRKQDWRSFVQLDVSQPALSTKGTSPFFETVSWDLGPVAELSFGFGY